VQPAEQLLTTLTETLELTERLIVQASEPDFWKPRSSSVFDGELQNTEKDTNNIPWGPNEPTMAYEMAQVSLFPIGDHLASIRKLLVPPLSMLGQAVLARSVFESAAFAFWMTDPKITVRERVARIYAVLWDIAKTNLREATKHGSAEQAAGQDHLDSILARISELGFNIIKVNGKKVIDECGEIPTKTTHVAELFSGAVKNDYTKIYSPYSGVTHGEIAAVLTRRYTKPESAAEWLITPRQLTENVELPVAAFGTLYRRLCEAGMGTQNADGSPGADEQLWVNEVGERFAAIHRSLL
jgi:hypothetical protein